MLMLLWILVVDKLPNQNGLWEALIGRRAFRATTRESPRRRS